MLSAGGDAGDSDTVKDVNRFSFRQLKKKTNKVSYQTSLPVMELVGDHDTPEQLRDGQLQFLSPGVPRGQLPPVGKKNKISDRTLTKRASTNTLKLATH